MLEQTSTPEQLAVPIPTITQPVEVPTISAARKIFEKIRHFFQAPKSVDAQQRSRVRRRRWFPYIPEYRLEDPTQPGITITASGVTFNLVKVNEGTDPATDDAQLTFPNGVSSQLASQFFSQLPIGDQELILAKKEVSLVYEVVDSQKPDQSELPTVLDTLRVMGGAFCEHLRRIVIIIRFPKDGHFGEVICPNSPDLLALTALAEYLKVACHNRINVAVVLDLQTEKQPEEAHGRFGAPLASLNMISEDLRFTVISTTSDGKPPFRKRMNGKARAGLRNGKIALKKLIADNITSARLRTNEPVVQDYDQTFMG